MRHYRNISELEDLEIETIQSKTQGEKMTKNRKKIVISGTISSGLAWE